MYSTSVTGAFGDPSTLPFCGMPLKSCLHVGRARQPFASDPRAGVELDDDFPPVRTKPSTIASTISATAARRSDQHLR